MSSVGEWPGGVLQRQSPPALHGRRCLGGADSQTVWRRAEVIKEGPGSEEGAYVYAYVEELKGIEGKVFKRILKI